MWHSSFFFSSMWVTVLNMCRVFKMLQSLEYTIFYIIVFLGGGWGGNLMM